MINIIFKDRQTKTKLVIDVIIFIAFLITMDPHSSGITVHEWLATAAIAATRQSGAIIYPVWEFNDVPVDRAMDPANRLYLWVDVNGVQSYPTIWAHGLDSRTFFPATDETIQGCLP